MFVCIFTAHTYAETQERLPSVTCVYLRFKICKVYPADVNIECLSYKTQCLTTCQTLSIVHQQHCIYFLMSMRAWP